MALWSRQADAAVPSAAGFAVCHTLLIDFFLPSKENFMVYLFFVLFGYRAWVVNDKERVDVCVLFAFL